MNPVAAFLTHADIGPLGATVAHLLKLTSANGLRADRRDILTAARELDWRVVPNGVSEVVLPPPSRPIKLGGYDE